MTWLPPAIAPIVLLLISNVFMTFAWYGHLKFTDRPLWLVVVASWGIAFIEYCFAVPANRWGHAVYSAAELKTMQEVITLAVFAVPHGVRQPPEQRSEQDDSRTVRLACLSPRLSTASSKDHPTVATRRLSPPPRRNGCRGAAARDSRARCGLILGAERAAPLQLGHFADEVVEVAGQIGEHHLKPSEALVTATAASYRARRLSQA